MQVAERERERENRPSDLQPSIYLQRPCTYLERDKSRQSKPLYMDRKVGITYSQRSENKS